MAGPASINITTTTASTLIVNPATWAADDLYVYRPVVPEGWFFMGDYAANKHGDKSPSLFLMQVVNDDPNNPLLAPPTDYVDVATEYTGKPLFTIQKPVPPTGYVALGGVAKGGDLSKLMCLNQSAAMAGTLGDMIFRDLWTVDNAKLRLWGQQITLANGNTLACNTFYPLAPSRPSPPDNAQVWAPRSLLNYGS